MKAIILLKMSSLFKDDMERALIRIKSLNGVKKVYGLFGPHDAFALVEFKDLDELNSIVHSIYSTGMVRETDTRVIMEEFE